MHETHQTSQTGNNIPLLHKAVSVGEGAEGKRCARSGVRMDDDKKPLYRLPCFLSLTTALLMVIGSAFKFVVVSDIWRAEMQQELVFDCTAVLL